MDADMPKRLWYAELPPAGSVVGYTHAEIENEFPAPLKKDVRV